MGEKLGNFLTFNLPAILLGACCICLAITLGMWLFDVGAQEPICIAAIGNI